MTMVLLKFVAAYLLFDSVNILFSSALKGAGDVYYVVMVCTGLGVSVMLLPTWLFCSREDGLGIYGAWTFITLFICLLSTTFVWRFLQGRWRHMRVVEHHSVVEDEEVLEGAAR